MTAWRLFSSGRLKELTRRTARFLLALNKTKEEILYPEWRRNWVELNESEREKIVQMAIDLPHNPSFSLLLNNQEQASTSILKTINSILNQLYPNWILFIDGYDLLDKKGQQKIFEIQDTRIKIVDSYPSNSSELGEWVVEVAPGVQLDEKALFANALAIVNNPEVKIVYGDHDHIDASNNFCDPHMKPDWNPDLFAAMNYLGPLIAVEKELWIDNRTEKTDLNGLLSQTVESVSGDEIFHICDVLASVPVTDSRTHLSPNCKRTIHPLPEPNPSVSILIPTRDNGRMLDKCLKSIFEETSYSNFEVILVDHETSESKALKVIEEFKKKESFKTINFSGSFNFASMMNLAGAHAEGDVLILLNNDVEAIDSGWLQELVSQVSRPEVGIVGALLLFSDGTIQHAGIHPGLGGLMGHGHKHLLGDSSGYFSRLKAVHSVAAVTGACMAVKKSTWVDLGGMNEDLAVAYNDVDLCLKARNSGLRVLFTPFARLLHHESVSRGIDESVEKNQRLQDEIKIIQHEWGSFLDNDPAYNTNLSFDGGGFKLNKNPANNFKTIF